jgi:hypothetical protein
MYDSGRIIAYIKDPGSPSFSKSHLGYLIEARLGSLLPRLLADHGRTPTQKV